MRLESSLFAGRESLMVHGQALNVIGDDLANSNTPGFKSSRVEFADILAGSTGNLMGDTLQIGNGVKATDISINHSLQGAMEVTGRGLDAGISGDGWFVLQKDNQQYFTRAGNFTTDEEGNLISATGANVLGYTTESPDAPVALNINTLVGQATATSEVGISGTLNPISALVNGLPPATTYQSLNSTASFTNTVRVNDSLGNERDVALYFYRTGNLTWTVNAYADGSQTGGTAGTPVQIGTGQIVTGPDGKQVAGAGATMTLTPAWADGAAAGNIAVDLSKITAVAGESSFSNVTANGFRGGVVKSVGFNEAGVLGATLDSGEIVTVADLALADFKSPDGLERIGDNLFIETTESGTATIAKAGTEGLGTIKGNSLESSTVDAANEFVKMIQIQQGYRAGSQVVQAVNELLTATIQIA